MHLIGMSAYGGRHTALEHKKGRKCRTLSCNPKATPIPSKKYRVVFDRDWMAFVNRATTSVAIAGESDTYGEAELHRDKLNGMDNNG